MATGYQNAKGTRGYTINKLNLKETLALNRILVERYAASKMDNPTFALSVSTDPVESALFRFPINSTHISTAIKGADIPPNRPYVAHAQPTDNDNCFGLTVRVQALEDQLGKLTAWLVSKGFK